jgi:hypothetical protein
MSEINSVIFELNGTLDDIESKAAQDNMSAAALEEFKVSLDGIRTTVLALLTATDVAGYKDFVRKFHLRRAAQVSQNVLSGIVDGTITAETPGFEQLLATVDETLAAVAAA